MAEADARARIAAQASREERLAKADIVVDNSATGPRRARARRRWRSWDFRVAPAAGGRRHVARPPVGIERCLRSRVVSDFEPAGDQPNAIATARRGHRRAAIASRRSSASPAAARAPRSRGPIEKVQRPTLVLAPNKSLAAQLANEFREFFPDNRVEYFVSYYDYYQPEAYIPSSDTYIEKDSSINDEIDRLRHSATAALLTRRDVIVVASVSCIYGMGNPRGVPRHSSSRCKSARSTTSGRSCASSSTCSTTATTPNLGRGRVPGPRRHDRGASRRTRRRSCASSCSATRSSASRSSTRSPASRCASSTSCSCSPPPTTWPATSVMRAAVVGIEAELQERLAWFESQRQAARGSAAAHAHAVRPRDDPGGRLLQRHRELLDAHRRPGLRRAALHAPRLLPEGLPPHHRREPRRRAAAPRAVRGRPEPQGHAGRPRLPVAERRATTDRSASKR